MRLAPFRSGRPTLPPGPERPARPAEVRQIGRAGPVRVGSGRGRPGPALIRLAVLLPVRLQAASLPEPGYPWQGVTGHDPRARPGRWLAAPGFPARQQRAGRCRVLARRPKPGRQPPERRGPGVPAARSVRPRTGQRQQRARLLRTGATPDPAQKKRQVSHRSSHVRDYSARMMAWLAQAAMAAGRLRKVRLEATPRLWRWSRDRAETRER